MKCRTLILSSAIVATSSMAAADTTDRAAAQAIFRAGKEAMARGDWATACARFEDSHRFEPNAAGPLLNGADCEERRGRFRAAWIRYGQALDLLSPDDPRRAYARKHREAMEKRLARVTIEVPTGVASLVLDSETLAPETARVAMDPGTHTLMVTAPHHTDRTQTFVVAEGEEMRVRALPGSAMVAEGRNESVVASLPSTAASPRKAIGVALVVAGGAGLVASAVAAALVIDRGQTYRSHCDGDGACDAEGLSAAKEGKTLSTLATFALAGGAAATSTGIVLLLLPTSTGTPSMSFGYGARF